MTIPNQPTITFDAANPGWHRVAPLAIAVLVAIAGCAAPRPPRPAGDAATPAPTTSSGAEPAAPSAPARPSAPVAPSPLLVEKRWLEDWFRGTPVMIALPGDNLLTVDVPLMHSFGRGSPAVKPALAAVLDRVATSVRRQAGLRVSIAAPPDVGGTAALAANRGQQVRDHLVARGVPASRIGGMTVAPADAPLQLQIVATAQPIARLDDAKLPPTPAAKPAAAPAASQPRH